MVYYYILRPREANSSVPISSTTTRWSNVGYEQTWEVHPNNFYESQLLSPFSIRPALPCENSSSYPE